ncbi:MAG: hypothetical protein JNL95_03840 [Chitinophagales bacterium]|nr:hypothetical protein [Chitinophagales bacterium]
MKESYTSKYFLNHDKYLGDWNRGEFEKYLSLLESLDEASLLLLHQFCGIQMFEKNEQFDKEQAIRVLINPADTPHQELIDGLNKLEL